MKVVKKAQQAEQPATTPIFVGTVHSARLIEAETSPQVTVTLVRFTDGGKNRPHVHSADQILYVTEGHGIVASTTDEHPIETGDIAHIPAGEVHWHGAQPGRDMAHLSILPPCETRVLD